MCDAYNVEFACVAWPGQHAANHRFYVRAVLEGRQLVKKDFMGLGKSDPYAVVECKGRRFQTVSTTHTHHTPYWPFITFQTEPRS